MKCQHCGSKDIITIQGQNFCLNCGVEVVAHMIPVVKTSKKKNTSSSTQAVNSSYAPAAKPQISQASASHPQEKQKPSEQSRAVHPLRFALKVASSLSIAVGSLIGAAIWFELDNDLLLYCGAACLVLVVIFMVLAQSALLYGFAKKFDGHPTPHRLWWAAARSGFMDIININLINLIILTATAGIDLAAWQLIAGQETWPPYLTATILGLLNIVLAWILLGTYVAKRLAVPAVVVGGMTSLEALRIGWRFYLKAGGHLVAAALEVMVVRVFAAAIVAMVFYVIVDVQWGTASVKMALGVGLLTTLASFIAIITLLEFEMRIWQRQYRQWASMLPAALRFRLVAGRARTLP